MKKLNVFYMVSVRGGNMEVLYSRVVFQFPFSKTRKFVDGKYSKVDEWIASSSSQVLYFQILLE